MIAVRHPHRAQAIDIAFRQVGQVHDRTSCAALQRVIHLLAADCDEVRAAMALIAILDNPMLAAIVAAEAPHSPIPAADRTAQDALPGIARRFSGSAPEPAGDRTLVDLQLALDEAWVRLGNADEIREAGRWERETRAARAEIARLEALIEDAKRSAA